MNILLYEQSGNVFILFVFKGMGLNQFPDFIWG